MMNTTTSTQHTAHSIQRTVGSGLDAHCSLLRAERGFTSTSEKHANIRVRGVRAPSKQTPKGFTLIETLVAISVLLLSLAGPLSIAAQSLQSAYYARDQITAFYLAQEGVEYVRAVRDQNYLAGASWLTGIDNCLDESCAIDFPNFTHEVCPTETGCPFMQIGDTTGLYNLSSGRNTIYKRTLEIDSISGTSDEVTVRVVVSWQSGKLERSFEIHEQLFNWL